MAALDSRKDFTNSDAALIYESETDFDTENSNNFESALSQDSQADSCNFSDISEKYAEPRPASQPEKHVIYKSMNYLSFTTRFELLKRGTRMKLVDLNPRQTVSIFDEKLPEFSQKKWWVKLSSFNFIIKYM